MATAPLPRPAAQNDAEGQDTSTTCVLVAAMERGADQVVPFHLRAWPVPSPATQNVAEAQATLVRAPAESICFAADHEVPLYVTAVPPAIITQKLFEEHDTSAAAPTRSRTAGLDQVVPL